MLTDSPFWKAALTRFIVLFCFLAVSAPVFGGDYRYEEDVWIDSEGVSIAANLFVPTNYSSDHRFPAVIFINSWALEEHEYIFQAAKLAEKGYIVLSYSTRGFGLSEGLINTAGPEDMKDFSNVVTWLENNTPVDSRYIAASGGSYGAGMSLLGAAHDSRISAVAALSGWANLTDSLYGNETPRLVWGGLLTASGALLGRLDPIVMQNYTDLLLNRNIPFIREWAGERSPITYIDELNRRQVPIYINNNFSDDLFQPNPMMHFFSQLTGPKHMDLSKGIHLSAEATGLIGLDNWVWGQVHEWLDHWLKGEQTSIVNQSNMTMEVKNVNGVREEFNNWPSATTGLRQKSYTLGKRGWFSQGSLNSGESSSGSNWIASGPLSGHSTGIPIVSSLLEAHTPIDIYSWLPGTNRLISIVYQTPRLSSDLKIRGIPTLDLWITPTNEQTQLVVHLYDVNSAGVGTLITHAPITLHDAIPWAPTKLSFELVATSYNLPAGHRLAVGIDTYDLNYGPPTLEFYDTKFHYGSSYPAKLNVPYRD